jgi:hypothetical protein
LTNLKKYKQIIAVLLMALYAFVATPVQLWHHHNYATASSSGTSDKKETASISTSSGKSVDGNCQICSHQYSTYSDYDTVVFTAPLFIATAKDGFYYSSIPSSPLFNFANKGPPPLA